MTQRISKHGTVYTEGSSSTPPPEYPKVCCNCSKRIYTSKQSYQMHAAHTPRGFQYTSWHLPKCPE